MAVVSEYCLLLDLEDQETEMTLVMDPRKRLWSQRRNNSLPSQTRHHSCLWQVVAVLAEMM